MVPLSTFTPMADKASLQLTEFLANRHSAGCFWNVAWPCSPPLIPQISRCVFFVGNREEAFLKKGLMFFQKNKWWVLVGYFWRILWFLSTYTIFFMHELRQMFSLWGSEVLSILRKVWYVGEVSLPTLVSGEATVWKHYLDWDKNVFGPNAKKASIV